MRQQIGRGWKQIDKTKSVIKSQKIKCSICGRKLRNTKSRELGYGPVCYKKKFGITSHVSRRDADASVLAGEEADHNLPGQMSMEDYLQTLLAQ